MEIMKIIYEYFNLFCNSDQLFTFQSLRKNSVYFIFLLVEVVKLFKEKTTSYVSFMILVIDKSINVNCL